MTSAAEMFVVSLARASKRASRHLRGLTRADREDVQSTALLWCWENKATYNPATPLDDWFFGAIRNARKAFERGEAKHSAELAEVIAVPDETSWHTEIREAVQTMTDSMDTDDERIVRMKLDGCSHDDIAARMGLSTRTVRSKVRRMRAMIPESEHFNTVVRRSQSIDSDSAQQALAPIDKEIAQLEFAPPAGKDCPPCWRCKWWEGLVPNGRTPVRIKIADPEIRAAVAETEARKISIAYGVRK